MKSKLALFADVHSNLEAVNACLEHARGLGAERFAFLGDLIGYGADPVAVLDLIEQYTANGAIVVLGNHDAAAIGRSTDFLNSSAQAAIDWTQTQLGEKQRGFLASLPLTVREDDILFVHASAVAPEQWIYVTGPKQAEESIIAAEANYVFLRTRARAAPLLRWRERAPHAVQTDGRHPHPYGQASSVAGDRWLRRPAARRE